ncbi:putative Protein arginine N-methyltransferase [Monocercomonoides exilis]|uniref:putative Protein arginine N-methyltransferase n=1 Tax=Monocercomonoides exilis TaxID=2049356 RepID=UPI00355ABF9D|nr:putative Protein arginine N-methyltransferase [Monocercomonoides exilis]|eukprot:MONOS_2509.1-p1 / transcript=MONOS_2509.1 / gene=MONOS_2509 / organism=Monocercomonoides_exilis_PA203 / gene_product=RecName / transcript_product=RecName / location=Mono_scaffold00052:72649-74427(+) / protein_length=549 / sequence_SO=supercontig / SO=protein_coding / is_pseudo=false
MSENVENKKQESPEDQPYFESYSHLSIHLTMLKDQIRTLGYRNAIFKAAEDFKDKVVLDVGCGTGILSHFCLKAGAKKVYAVDASEIAEQAKLVAQANGVADKLIIIKGRIEEVELPEQVDIIVSEWMGHGLLYESMFDSVIVAREKWLKKDTGFLFPSHARMFMAPFNDEEYYHDTISFWKDVYGVNMKSIIPFAKKCFYHEAEVATAAVEQITANEICLKEFELKKTTAAELRNFSSDFTFKSQQIGEFNGFCVWFDVAFESPSMRKRWLDGEDVNALMMKSLDDIEAKEKPSSSAAPPKFVSTWHSAASSSSAITPREAPKPLRESSTAEGYTPFVPCAPILSTSPFAPPTHWSQTLLHLPLRLYLLQDDEIKGRIELNSMDVKVSRKMLFKLDLETFVEDEKEKAESSKKESKEEEAKDEAKAEKEEKEEKEEKAEKSEKEAEEESEEEESEDERIGEEEPSFVGLYRERAFRWMDAVAEASKSRNKSKASRRKGRNSTYYYKPGNKKEEEEGKDNSSASKTGDVPLPPPISNKREIFKFEFALE